MNDLFSDFESYFREKNVLGNAAIFFDATQDDPHRAVTLYEYQGLTGLPQVAGAVRSMQIVIRDSTVVSAKALANEIYRSLLTEDGILNLTPTRWCMIVLKHPPFKVKVDDKGRPHYGFNVGITTYID